MRLFRNTLCYWLLFASSVVALWWCAAQGFETNTDVVLRALACALFCANAIHGLRQAITGTFRWFDVRRCRHDPAYLQRCVNSLDAIDRNVRRMALQTLADYHDHPFGLIECWPFESIDDKRLNDWTMLYKEWMTAGSDADWEAYARRMMEQLRPVEQERLPERLLADEASSQELAGAVESPPPGLLVPETWGTKAERAVERFADTIKDVLLDLGIADEARAAETVSQPLPPMSKEQFIDEALAQVEGTLDQLADAINEAPTARAIFAGEENVCALFGKLGSEVLEIGLQLRIDTALAGTEQAANVKPRKARVKRLEASRLSHDPGSQGGWVEKYRRMKAREDN